jgi:hypothetical protein
MRRNNRNEPEHVRLARRKVRSKKWFFRHFSIYLAASFFFFSINMLDSGMYDPWFLYPVISWGTLVAIQYLWTFGLPFTKAGTREWEERELARELARSAPDYQEEQQVPVQRLISDSVNMDDHLELQEVSKEKVIDPIYRNDDLV